jgi:glycine/serine hydroxymethyltransferase
MKQIASFIAQAVKSETGHDKIADGVNKLCKAFPAYPQS